VGVPWWSVGWPLGLLGSRGGPLGAHGTSWDPRVDPKGLLGGPWGPFGGPWGVLGCLLGAPGGSLGVPWKSPGSLGLLGRFWGSLGSPLWIFQNSVFRRGGSA